MDSTTLNALDALVESGVHGTRSEAAARLIMAIYAKLDVHSRYEAIVKARETGVAF